MAVQKLTQLAVDRLGPSTKLTKDGKPTHDVRFDTLLPSFGVRVSPKGKKSWIANTWPGGKLTPVTLGSTAMIPSIATARDMAREAMLKAKQGIDPVEARRQQAAETKATSEAEKAQAQADSFTFAVLVDQYLAWSKAEHRKATYDENRRMLLRVIKLTDFGPRPARDITTRELKAFRDGIEPGKDGRIERSNIVPGAVGRMYGWAVDRDKIETNPATGIKPAATAKPRERTLSDAECKAYWDACGDLGYPFGSLFRLLLVCGQRLRETAEMRWSEIDLPNKVWTLPASRTKNKKAHRVPLSDLAATILKSLPRWQGDHVFSTTGGKTAVNGFGYAKAKIEAAMGVDDWGLHDCRRTLATNMQRLRVQLPVTESILNHTSGSRSGIVGIYQRYDYAEEKIEALTKWGDFLARLVGENVVALRSA